MLPLFAQKSIKDCTGVQLAHQAAVLVVCLFVFYVNRDLDQRWPTVPWRSFSPYVTCPMKISRGLLTQS